MPAAPDEPGRVPGLGGPQELASRLREQTACDDPDAAETSGLVALFVEVRQPTKRKLVMRIEL